MFLSEGVLDALVLFTVNVYPVVALLCQLRKDSRSKESRLGRRSLFLHLHLFCHSFADNDQSDGLCVPLLIMYNPPFFRPLYLTTLYLRTA
ncbi:hypothetical protein PILCRDRAFT_810099 [Piloderma croceum F 1598]|uniref:Uncharacterized protein n=1 Tax=Piloderma croceum (strain F 1598) TaxID=765440 RepID=A0A0C3G763_PILCF|nr:hypothetical protein PILCRDRAFT_810099 [Piloderma croceum F 1598]